MLKALIASLCLIGPVSLNWADTAPEPQRQEAPRSGIASWYGEQHRGRLMANGRPFDPDKLTAASWFFPLGTRVRVRSAESGPIRSVEVTITDRGPARRLVAEGRIIDLGRAAFAQLADLDKGLLQVTVERLPGAREGS